MLCCVSGDLTFCIASLMFSVCSLLSVRTSLQVCRCAALCNRASAQCGGPADSTCATITTQPYTSNFAWQTDVTESVSTANLVPVAAGTNPVPAGSTQSVAYTTTYRRVQTPGIVSTDTSAVAHCVCLMCDGTGPGSLGLRQCRPSLNIGSGLNQ